MGELGEGQMFPDSDMIIETFHRQESRTVTFPRRIIDDHDYVLGPKQEAQGGRY